MATTSVDARTLRSAAFAALEAGDYRGASEQFTHLVATGAADAAAWFGLSRAHRHLGAAAEEKNDPRHLVERDDPAALRAEPGGE